MGFDISVSSLWVPQPESLFVCLFVCQIEGTERKN
jgi:hypothetical protein